MTTMRPGEAFRDRLRRGELVIGSNIRHSRTSEIGAILHDCGFHWMMLDNEHSPMPPDLMYDIGLGAVRAGMVPLARTRHNDEAEIGCLLTNGVLGVIVPHVHTAEAAAKAARSMRYPPDGNLSVPGSIPQFGYKYSLHEATQIFNREVVCVVMIESREALENLDAIAATPGIDVLFIGASDLSYELGVAGDYGGPVVDDAVRRVCAAAKKNGIFAGMGAPKEEEHWKRYIGYGIQMILTENDLTMMMQRAKDRAAFFDRLHKAK